MVNTMYLQPIFSPDFVVVVDTRKALPESFSVKLKKKKIVYISEFTHNSENQLKGYKSRV